MKKSLSIKETQKLLGAEKPIPFNKGFLDMLFTFVKIKKK